MYGGELDAFEAENYNSAELLRKFLQPSKVSFEWILYGKGTNLDPNKDVDYSAVKSKKIDGSALILQLYSNQEKKFSIRIRFKPKEGYTWNVKYDLIEFNFLSTMIYNSDS